MFAYLAIEFDYLQEVRNLHAILLHIRLTVKVKILVAVGGCFDATVSAKSFKDRIGSGYWTLETVKMKLDNIIASHDTEST
jgi:hypothetical protein